MRHVISALLASFLLVYPALSQGADAIAFAGVPWRSGVAAVKSVMAERGFTFDKVDAQGDLQFTGTVLGEESIVFALFNTDRELVKWSVVLVTPDDRTLVRYRELKAQLTERYGDPFGDIEEWKFPYDGGDHLGHEAMAIRRGKAALMAGWQTPETSFPSVVIEVTDRMTVRASYEGPGWKAEADQRVARRPLF
jgi:hypothetical protein